MACWINAISFGVGAATLLGAASVPARAENPAKAPGVEPLPPRGIAYHWTPEQQIVGYMKRMQIEPTRMVGAGDGSNVRHLPLAVHQISPHWTWNGQPMDVDRYMEATRVSGVIVLKDGKILYERYGLGRTPKDHWDGQSTTKSVTALLIGAAIHDGYIKGMGSPVTDYLPELKGSAYEGVTISQLATMTSGVKWDEKLLDQQWKEPFVNGVDPTVAFMSRLPRANEPGTKFNYSSADSDLAGILVSKAVGSSLAEYLSVKIWQPFGMEKEAYWVTDAAGIERGGGTLLTTLRDFARIGQFVLEGGKAGGVQVLPRDWLAQATNTQLTLSPSDGFGFLSAEGYGYNWWTYKDHFAAIGHAGQRIFIYPKDNLVIALNSVWPEDRAKDYYPMEETFIDALHKAAAAHP
ncbi:serine hydrolase domain-containing protein [Bradyrhizobium tunisiense]|uniref:serine hydrolase domain-containing protein n=1 Tax=Bradyrhizobium tunisiense TaxID=3278709 RepID=UPI0035D72E22